MGSLVIVESAAKASTIQKYLNGIPELSRHGAFVVMASMGHVRQIPSRPPVQEGALHGIQLNTWMPIFEVEESKRATVAKLKKAAEKAATVWLATDPDREGEGIAWHLAKLLKLGLDAPRVRYNEITQSALREAFTHPGKVDQKMVKAQMSRQMLDRIVGYQVSPLVIDLVGSNASAGRVQSAALRLSVERVEELEATDWVGARKITLTGTFSQNLDATCRTPFSSMDALITAVDVIIKSGLEGVVKRADAKSEQEAPPPPFSTSAMQQAAHRALRMNPKETMQHAQALFAAGHITYMRTDSTTLSEVAIAALLERVRATYGEAMTCRREHKTRAANAQEAHEAIRPTVPRDASEIGITDAAQARLYDLIYKRTLATQMAPAVYDALEYTILTAHTWEGKARRLASPGWKTLYANAASAGTEEAAESQQAMPVGGACRVGATVRLEAITGGERLPTARSPFCEAALVKAMEDAGVGRPSTYASTLDKLQEREFVKTGALEGPQVALDGLSWKAPSERVLRKRTTQLAFAFKDVLVPTAKGRTVMDYLKTKFTNLVDLQFTSSMETALDRIAEGAADHKATMTEFFRSLEPQVAAARATTPRSNGDAAGANGAPTFEGGWTLIENQFGPALRGPRSDEGKSRFVSVNHYLTATKKTLEQITQADVDFLMSLPRPIGGDHVVADSRNGFYVTGPVVKGDLPDAIIAMGAAITLSGVEAALASKLRRFQIGAAEWVAREGPKGPYLQGPRGDDDKPRFVDLKFFLEWKKKPLAALTHEDVRKLSSLPRTIGGGMTLGVGMYGFYAKDAEGKYKNLNDDLSERIDTVTLIEVQGMTPAPRREPRTAASSSASSKGGSASAKGSSKRVVKKSTKKSTSRDDDDDV